MGSKSWKITKKIPARHVATPQDISKKGDWSPWTVEGKPCLIIRCPLCAADGAYPSRKNTFFNRLKILLGFSPHRGSLVCPQNRSHQFALKKSKWNIITKVE